MSSVIGLAEDSIARPVRRGQRRDHRRSRPGPAGRPWRGVPRGSGGRPFPCVRRGSASLLPTIGGYEAAGITEGLRVALGPDVPILGGGSSPEDPAAALGTTESRQIVGDAIPRIRSRSCCSRATSTSRSASRRAGAGSVRSGSSPGPAPTACWRSMAGLQSSSTSGTWDWGSRPSAIRRCSNNRARRVLPPDAVQLRSGDRPRAVLRDRAPGFDRPDTTAGTEQIFDGARASMASALAGSRPDERPTPRSCTPARRRFLLGTRAGHEVEVVTCGAATSRRRVLPPRRDRPDRPIGRSHPVPQRDIVSCPARRLVGHDGRGSDRSARGESPRAAAPPDGGERPPPGGVPGLNAAVGRVIFNDLDQERRQVAGALANVARSRSSTALSPWREVGHRGPP